MPFSVEQLLTQAKSFLRKGDKINAEQAYRTVLARFPMNKRAIAGLQALNLHKPASARAKQPLQDQINALMMLFNRGQLKEVVQHASMLTHNHPNAVMLYDLLGAAHASLRNFDQSIKCYQKALQIKPDFAEGHNNLGNALRIQGRWDEAIASFKRVVEIKPDFPEAYQNLASNLKRQGHIGEAVENYKKAILIAPNNAHNYNNLGNAQYDMGCFDDAVISMRKALEIDPNLAQAHLNLGGVLKAQGQSDDAIACFKAALKIKPDFAEAYRNYTTAQKIKTEDDYTTQIPKLLQSENISQNDRMHLSYALGKAKLDMGRESSGIKLLTTANTLCKKKLNYDISTDELLFQDIKNTFVKIHTKSPAITYKSRTKTVPVFILGMPRSGTTLTEQIISSHSDVYGAGELNFMTQAINDIDWKRNHLSSEALKTIRTSYFTKLSGLNADQYFITDKMPHNFRWIGFIATAFPEAKIIHIKRDPAAVCWSNFKMYFPAAGMGYSCDMEDVAHYYGRYHDLMRFWHQQFPNRIYDLEYERLTENQLEETQKLLAYLELDWEDSVLDFHKNQRAVATSSSHQVRNKMYTGSSQEWQKYKDDLGPMLKILNQLPTG